MSNLDYLEASREFRSYYRTLRDLNFYFRNDPELSNEQIQTATTVITRLIYDFIGVNGTTFREMDLDLYSRVYEIFLPDLLAIIQNSGENDVDFDVFADLMDEILEIANLRLSALEKIPGPKQEDPTLGDGSAGSDEDDPATEETLDDNGNEDETSNNVVGVNDTNKETNSEIFIMKEESEGVRVGVAITNEDESVQPSYQYREQSNDYKVYRKRYE